MPPRRDPGERWREWVAAFYTFMATIYERIENADEWLPAAVKMVDRTDFSKSYSPTYNAKVDEFISTYVKSAPTLERVQSDIDDVLKYPTDTGEEEE